MNTKRVRRLYSNGGLRDIVRGLRDYAIVDTDLPMHLIFRSLDLSVGDITVELRVRRPDAVYWTLQRAQGHGEDAVIRDFIDEVHPEDHVWDIGANIGSYSLLAAASGTSVTAFEPGADARADLLANADANDLRDRVDATPYALGDWTGQGVLLPAERSGIRELRRDADEGDTVPVARGDGLDLPAPDVIKIDVEGAELAVLDGLGQLLQDARALYVEVHNPDEREAVLQALRERGLEFAGEWDEILKVKTSTQT
jgi:FkbM family methyltransferase